MGRRSATRIVRFRLQLKAVTGMTSESFFARMMSRNGPLMRRFHKPGDEKRSVIVLPPSQYEEWLGCREPELARTFFRLPHEDEMTAEASPLPSRKPARPSGNEPNDLFGHP